MEKKKQIILCISMGLLLLVGFVAVQVKKDTAYSESERRILATKPKLTVESVASAQFMKDYETYLLDQFPGRDSLRYVKAFSQYQIFRKWENNNYYVKNGYLSKLDDGLSYPMLDHANDCIRKIYETYLEKENIKPYFLILPDKNYYLASMAGQKSIDYETLYAYEREQLPFLEIIDVRNKLSIDNYYFTDSHWKQESILETVKQIQETMNLESNTSYRTVTLEEPFYGVYSGQSAIKVEGDTLSYLTNDVLEECTVTEYDSGKPKVVPLYDEKKASGKDGYDVFLGGAKAVLRIDNPNTTMDKNLVLFRDSFGSSLAPLLVENYKSVTLVDIRYIRSDMVGAFVDFTNCDVLFEYNVMMLNSSMGMN